MLRWEFFSDKELVALDSALELRCAEHGYHDVFAEERMLREIKNEQERRLREGR